MSNNFRNVLPKRLLPPISKYSQPQYTGHQKLKIAVPDITPNLFSTSLFIPLSILYSFQTIKVQTKRVVILL